MATSSKNNRRDPILSRPKARSNNRNNANFTPDGTPNEILRYSPTEEDTDPSPDQPHYFSKARSTPIIYSSSVASSSSSSSISEEIIKRQREHDNRSLCSVQSGLPQQQQQQQQSSDNSSTRNQIFYFSTPLPPQRHQPYHYHGGTPATTTPSSNNDGQQQRRQKSKFKNLFTRSSSNNQTTSGAASIKSAISTGRQTMKSWRQKRINILLKKRQHLPDVETETFCHDCEKYITTRIRYRNGSMVWLSSFVFDIVLGALLRKVF
ncbi:unnamed protein product [Mucor hiemalis]